LAAILNAFFFPQVLSYRFGAPFLLPFYNVSKKSGTLFFAFGFNWSQIENLNLVHILVHI